MQGLCRKYVGSMQDPIEDLMQRGYASTYASTYEESELQVVNLLPHPSTRLYVYSHSLGVSLGVSLSVNLGNQGLV